MWLWREKFYFNESYKYTHFDDISGIITDEFPDDTIVNTLRNAEVNYSEQTVTKGDFT